MGVVGRLDQYASMLAWEFDDYSMSENLLTYSEQFNDASWAKNNYNVTANATTAPDGTLTADKLIAINASTFHDLYKSPGLGSNTYTLSIFAKVAEQSFIQLRIDDGVLSRVAMFNLATGSVSSSSNVTSPTITSYPNGWYRCSITVTTNIINVVFNGFPTSSNANYSGDGVSGVFIWGAQFEYGSVATNYTPTTTTAINRVLASTTNTNITGLGTYYASEFSENVGITTALDANVFPPYDIVYDDFGGTLFGAGQGRYMRQNTDKSVIVYNEIDEVTPSTIAEFRNIVTSGLVLDLDAGIPGSYTNPETIWRDLSGSGNNGTLVNGPTYSSANSGSIVFDGVDDYVSTSYAPTFNDFTVIAWFNPTTSNIFYNRIVDKDYISGMWLGRNASNANSWGGGVLEATGPFGRYITLQDESWHMIASIRQGTTHTIYGDGITNTISGTVSSAALSATAFKIGADVGNAVPIQGNIAQVSIYNRALTAAEVLQNYNALRNRYGL